MRPSTLSAVATIVTISLVRDISFLIVLHDFCSVNSRLFILYLSPENQIAKLRVASIVGTNMLLERTRSIGLVVVVLKRYTAVEVNSVMAMSFWRWNFALALFVFPIFR